MVTDQQIEADAKSFDDERRDFWHQTGSINERGEFKQFLHIWIMSCKGPGPASVKEHEVLPWIAVWDKPALSDMSAYWHVTNFKGFPYGWEDLWDHITAMRNIAVSSMACGPYWMLLEHGSLSALGQKMAGMKRRITNELFLTNKTQSISAVNAELFYALTPFLVMTPQQETEDEAVRSREVRGHNVPNGYISSLGRPPRCR